MSETSLIIEENRSLAEFTSWQVGGAAQKYCAPRSIDELKEALIWAHQNNHAWSILGGGTNILISDEGVNGLLIHTHLLNQSEIVKNDSDVIIEALAGTPKAEVLKHFLKLRLAPAIFLAGLPGDMAGGIVMNAGVGHKVSPKEFCEIVHSFDVIEMNEAGVIVEKSFSVNDITWEYRKSHGWQPGIITKVQVKWPNQPDDEVLKSVRAGNKRRKETQPLNQPSCGSVFKNPAGDHAGRLIEECGLKGFSIGGAQVSEKHANFIVNTGTATATEIHQLIRLVEKTVLEEHQVALTNEVVYIGRWD